MSAFCSDLLQQATLVFKLLVSDLDIRNQAALPVVNETCVRGLSGPGTVSPHDHADVLIWERHDLTVLQGN